MLYYGVRIKDPDKILRPNSDSPFELDRLRGLLYIKDSNLAPDKGVAMRVVEHDLEDDWKNKKLLETFCKENNIEESLIGWYLCG